MTIVMTAQPAPAVVRRRLGDQAWMWAVAAVTVGAFVVAIGSAPPADVPPGQGLAWLLFVGSAVHVASTGWLFTFRDVRSHAKAHPGRYVAAPVALVVAGAVLAGLVSPRHLDVLLLGYFGWQFFHYQKQNLGLTALAGATSRVGSLGRTERRSIMATGWIGIAALMLRPGTLQLALTPGSAWFAAMFAVATVAFGVAALVGVVVLIRRPSPDRPVAFCVVYLIALCFPLPIFVFSSPYAAVGGMTIAHGMQYLVLVGLVARGPAGQRASLTRLTVFATTVLVGGAVLSVASHLHTGDGFARAVFGAYLGVVMAHFVVDAGIWRLRDPFPRQFMSARIPAVLGLSALPLTDVSASGVG